MSKQRSGLAFQRRPYNKIYLKAITSNPVCPAVTLADIATDNNNNSWSLNNDTIILPCQTLLIPVNIRLLTNSFTLTNNGTITLNGLIRNAADLTTDAINCKTVNNGVINISSTGAINAVDSNSNTFINNGRVNNNGGSLVFQSAGLGINNSTGIITNSNGGQILTNISVTTNMGRINNNTGCIIYINPDFSTFDNSGRIYNAGGTINVSEYIGGATGNSTFNNTGIIYNYQNGVINNGGTFTNLTGIIHNPIVDAGCGVGTLVAVSGGTIDTKCP